MGKSSRRLKQKEKNRKKQHQRKNASYSSSSSYSINSSKISTLTKKKNNENNTSSPDIIIHTKSLKRYLSPSSNILVLGDGDFSFGAALLKLIRSMNSSALNDSKRRKFLTVTGYDSKQEAMRKYHSNLQKSLNYLGNNNSNNNNDNDVVDVSTLFNIDATKLHTQRNLDKHNNKNLSMLRHDTIIFNFPHTGQQRVHINRAMISDFFQSVDLAWRKDDVNTKEGQEERQQKPRWRQVHVTIKNQRPYIDWNIQESAQEFNFELVKIEPFAKDLTLLVQKFGYRHQTTVGLSQATSAPPIITKEAHLAQTMIFRHVFDEKPKTQQTTDEKNPVAETDDDGKDGEENLITNDEETDKKAQVEALIQLRNEARSMKNWEEADRIRTILQTKYNISLCDSNSTTSNSSSIILKKERKTKGKKKDKSSGIKKRKRDTKMKK